MIWFFKIIYKRIKSLYEEVKFPKYNNLNIGVGTQFAFDNLDGIAPQLITIGENCVIAPKAVILTHDACLLPTTGQYIFKPVKIGNNTFIGYGSVIMPGLIIGSNVIIGANTVVTKNIPDNSVVAGVPAKIIGSTSDLKNKRIKDLQYATYDWKKKIKPSDIVIQQNALLDQYNK